MVGVRVVDLVKVFGKVVAVDHVSFEVRHGEFLTLLGPSGCGKTTTLRCVAGLEVPTSGEIYIGDRLVSAPAKGVHVPPEKRNVGMVFQNYALWPHMTVFDNVAYPLKVRKVPRREIRERVLKALELVGLKGFENRYPHQLSGGQQQRVALARALVMEPEVLLLDEPLSNLDAKLRERMRFELRDLQKRLGITVIYVTHDQAEAMAMSDRIAVMNAGRIEQIGTPYEIYMHPANKFVADFIGKANFIPVDKIEPKGDTVTAYILNGKLAIECTKPPKQASNYLLMIRPHDITILDKPEENTVEGEITKTAFLGNTVTYWIKIDEHELTAETTPRQAKYKPNQKVYIKIEHGVLVATE